MEPLFENISLPLEGIDWVIIGGESGTGAGKFHLEWARTIQKQTKAAGAAFFMKQLGAHATFKGKEIVLSDSHGGDWDEWPRTFAAGNFLGNSLRSKPGNSNGVGTRELVPTFAGKYEEISAPEGEVSVLSS